MDRPKNDVAYLQILHGVLNYQLSINIYHIFCTEIFTRCMKLRGMKMGKIGKHNLLAGFIGKW